MKKGFLLLVAAATTTILVSCGGGDEAQAATEFCDCYKDLMEAEKAAAEATTADDLISGAGASIEKQSEAIECVMKWKTKWDGKVDGDKVMEEIKSNHKDVNQYFEDKGIKL